MYTYKNIFIINSKLLVVVALLIVINGQKINFNDEFKLKLVTTYHIRFVVKIL